MEDRNILKVWATGLKGRLPLVGGLLVAGLTVLAWIVPYLASAFGVLTGESSAVFMIFLPLWWPGSLTASVIMRICKLDPTQYEELARSIAAISSILINGGATWALLALISKIVRSFKQNKSL